MIALFFIILFLIGWLINTHNQHKLLKEYTLGEPERTQKKIDEALKKQRSVVKGNISEQLFPLIVDSPFIASDLRFVSGNPIDYVIFDGLSEINSADDEIRDVIIADIKTGNAQLNLNQRKIKKAIQEGRVCFMTIRLDDEGKTVINKYYPKKDAAHTTT